MINICKIKGTKKTVLGIKGKSIYIVKILIIENFCDNLKQIYWKH